ncbi:MAG: transposase [Pseudomonadota bacterium]
MQFLIAHGGAEENIKQMCCDMSPAFIKGVTENFPDAKLTFDKFHIMKIANEAVDQVRREEQKQYPDLAKSRFAWLKNPENTSRAYHIKLKFQEIFNQTDEGINSLIQAAKARARGYRTTRNLIAMIYLIGGNLKFGLPT